MREKSSHEAPLLANACPDAAARIAMVSLPAPLPESDAAPMPPAALGDLVTQVQPVGWWPKSMAGRRGAPRRQLMYALCDGELPQTLQVGLQAGPGGEYSGPQVSCRIISKKNVGVELTEVNEAVFEFGGRSIGLRLGVRHANEHHWWEWIRIEELWSGPVCKAVRIGGYIEVEHFGDETYAEAKHVTGARNVHVQNWLRADVFAVMFANGVIQLACRHINNHMFDEGRDQHDALPLIGLTLPNAPAMDVTLDGSETRFDLGGIALNLDDAARAVSPDQPGALARDGDMIIYQPYAGVEIHGDEVHYDREDDFICKIEDGVVPRGAARSVRFSMGMGDAAPVVTRYVAPDWWYAHCRDFWPDDCLPVHDEHWNAHCDRQAGLATKLMADRPRGFDSGLETASWEGEIPYARLLWYYHTGEPLHFQVALNDAYHIADIIFDHATETIRMPGYPFGAIALPLFRTVGMTFGYLETGDPYLLECAESAAERYYWIDRHNWPRRSYGRDAMSLRSLIFLWDYVGNDHYLDMAREALGRLITCQRPDGSYGDQGQTVGIHGPGNEITKVWMAMMSNAPVIDYLLRCPDDPLLWEAAMRTGAFMLDAQLVREGRHGWGYEYKYGDNPGNPFHMMSDPVNFDRYPPKGVKSYGFEDRFLSVVSAHSGDPKYFEAWQRFFTGSPDHFDVKYTPYAWAHQWNARLEAGTLHIRPVLTGDAPKMEADIACPMGTVHVRCAQEGSQITLETSCDSDFSIVAHPTGDGEAVTLSSNGQAVLPSSVAMREG